MIHRVEAWLRLHLPCREDCFFWFLVLCQLAPVWSYRYLPTQDGPAHLANAVILRDWGSAGSRYHEVYEVHWQPLPNWTVHLLLAGLMHFLPALAAEKVVVSLYIVGLAFSFRYFLGALGSSAGYLAAAGLLLLFPRCLWMGFYNYCLSLVLLWLILGFYLRRPDPDARRAVVLCLVPGHLVHAPGWICAGGGGSGVAGGVAAPAAARAAVLAGCGGLAGLGADRGVS